MRRLILNADDFGLTSGVNRSIVEGHRAGVLTSATLMANASATAEGEDLARNSPSLGLGCHVVLVDGEPLVDPFRLGSLVAKGTSHFGQSIGRLGARSLAGQIDPDQVESEAIAQFRKLQCAGLTLTHFDTHKHAHMFPPVLEGVLRAARICGVPAVRNPFEPAVPFWGIAKRNHRLRKRSLQTRALRWLQPHFRQRVARAGLKTTDGTVGVAATGTLDGPLFARIVHELPEGTWEFVVHPGYCDDELRSANTRLLGSREVEHQLLVAAETRELLARESIQLISYADL